MGVFRRKRVINGKIHVSKDWYYDFKDEEKGKRVIVRGCTDKKVTELMRSERVLQVRKGEYTFEKKKIKKITFREMANYYLESYSKGLKKRWKEDFYIIECFNHYYGDKYIDEINQEMIQKFKSDRIKEVKGSTINRQFSTIRRIFNVAIQEGKLLSNPMKNIKDFNEKDSMRKRYLEEDEITALLACCPDTIKDIVILAMDTGMRKGEIFNLQWSDIDFRNRNINIKKSKNGKQRSIPLNNSIFDILVKRRLDSKGHEYIFKGKTGDFYKSIQRPFKAAVNKAGLENVHFHDLRHTFASNLAIKGHSPFVIQKLLGHSSLVMTERYSHLRQDIMREAVNDIESCVHSCVHREKVNDTDFAKSNYNIIKMSP